MIFSMITNPTGRPTRAASFSFSERDGNPEIYQLFLADLSLTRLTSTSGAESWPRVAPDGSRLVFAGEVSGQWDLYTSLPSDISAPLRLTNDAALDDQPNWMWDSQTIFFVRSGDIYSIGSDGSNLTLINNGLSGEQRPVGMP